MGPEDLLEKEKATHSSILAWRTYGQRSLVGKKSDTTEVTYSHYVMGQFVTQQQMFVQTFMFLLFTESFY